MIDRLSYFIASHAKRWPRIYDVYLRFRKKNVLAQFLCAYSKLKCAPVSFLQIGANDGLWYDPIRYFVIRKRWHGLIVEPIQESFQALERNYSHIDKKQIALIRAALAVEGESHVTLYRLEAEWLKEQSYIRRMALLRKTSFDRCHLEKFLREGEKEHVVGELVRAMTLRELSNECTKFAGTPQVVVLDIEGLESTVLRGHDFSNPQPEILIFEHAHMTEDCRKEIYDSLKSAGYVSFGIYPDTISIEYAIAAQLQEDSRAIRAFYSDSNV